MTQLSMFTEMGMEIYPTTKDFVGKVEAGRFLMLGGGLQSTAIAEMVLAGEIKPVDAVIMSDTGDEPPWVYAVFRSLIERFESQGVPVILARRTVRHWEDDDIELTTSMWNDIITGMTTTSLPLYVLNEDGSVGRIKRNCTSDYKVRPGNDVIRSWLYSKGYAKAIRGEAAKACGWHGLSHMVPVEWWGVRYSGPYVVVNEDNNKGAHFRIDSGVYVTMLYGITTDESDRVKDRGPDWQRAEYPLIEKNMSREDVKAWFRYRGLPLPQKSACFYCPYKSDSSWLWLKQTHPDWFERACIVDESLRLPNMTDAEVVEWYNTHQPDVVFDTRPIRHLIDNAELVRNRYQIAYHDGRQTGMVKMRGKLFLYKNQVTGEVVPLRDAPLEENVLRQQSKRMKHREQIQIYDNFGDVCGKDDDFSCFS